VTVRQEIPSLKKMSGEKQFDAKYLKNCITLIGCRIIDSPLYKQMSAYRFDWQERL
jgi:hypothetical protein